MSLLPGLTQSAPGVPLFAPASGGGGGGGSANPQVSTITFPPAVPTPGGPTSGAILFSEQLLIDDLATAIAGDFALVAAGQYPNGLAGATSTTSFTIFAPQNGCSLALGCGEDEVIYIDGAAGGGDPGVAVRGVGNVSISSMTISSINGAVPGGGSANPNPSFSTVNFPANGNIGMSQLLQFADPATGALQDVYMRTGTDANQIVTGFSPGGSANTIEINNPGGGGGGTLIKMGATDAGQGILAAVRSLDSAPSSLYIAADNVFIPYTVTMSSLSGNLASDKTSISSLTVSSINGAAPGGGGAPNLTASTLTLTGGANSMQLVSDNTATAKIWATGGSGLNISTLNTVNDGSLFISPSGLSDNRGWIQTGYCQDWPYASTVLFNVPYSNDNINVMLTPTIRNTSGGNNPTCSLGLAFGPNGNGVSSIGFQIDMRNNGSGFNGSFFYLAIPRNS